MNCCCCPCGFFFHSLCLCFPLFHSIPAPMVFLWQPAGLFPSSRVRQLLLSSSVAATLPTGFEPGALHRFVLKDSSISQESLKNLSRISQESFKNFWRIFGEFLEILKELTSKWVAPMPNRWQLEPSPEGKNPMKNPPENLSRILSRKGKRGRKTLHPATTTHTHTHTRART